MSSSEIAKSRSQRLRHRRNAATLAAGIKLGVFTVTSLLVTGLLAAIMGNVGFGEGREYQALFTTASNLKEGDDVRVAGVSVGEVKKVEHHERKYAKITFRVKSDVPMSEATRAEIRFLNLVGARYLALEEGRGADAAEEQDPEEVIPMERTSPSLDLTTLFNGFRPLFQALEPEAVNELSLNLVQVLQGEGGTVAGLLERTASLTTTLANRDQLIGEVIDNLNTTLTTIDSRSQQLTELIQELEGWMSDLARDRHAIGSSLDSIGDLTEVVAGFVREGRPILKQDIKELRRLARQLNKPGQTAELVNLLDRLPESMTDQTRTGTYGSWYQYYVCGATGTFRFPDNIAGVPTSLLNTILDEYNTFNLRSTAPRCND